MRSTDWGDIPVEDRGRAINVHSHAPDGVLIPAHLETHFPSEGTLPNRQPLNSGDLKVFEESYRKGQTGPRIALLQGDGTMEILGYTEESNPRALCAQV